jgi:hypothetical protein
VDLVVLKQGIDTTTPAGPADFSRGRQSRDSG